MTLLFVPLIGRLDPSGATVLVWVVFLPSVAVSLFPGGTGRAAPRFGGRLFGASAFPAALSLLLYFFPGKPETVATAWIVAVAGEAGGLLVRRFRPGVVPFAAAHALMAGAALAAAALLSAGRDLFVFPAWSALLLPVAAAAVTRSLPLRIDLRLPSLLAVGLLAGLSSGGEPPGAAWIAMRAVWALPAIAVAALAGVRTGAFDRRGALAGSFFSLSVLTAFGPGGALILLLFVAAGSAPPRLFRRAARAKRTGRHAAANLALPAFAGAVYLQSLEPLAVAAFCGAVAAMLADTISGEVGIPFGGTPRLILTGRAVPPGTDGAVSLAGSAAGVVGALAVGVAAWGGGLIGAGGVVAVTVAGMAGSVADSMLGASLERAGILGNGDVNYLGALAGALTAAAMISIAGTETITMVFA